jgi:hypothetical protein
MADGTCAPLEAKDLGYAYECQGTGNGWLTLTVYPVGKQPPECVNWGENGKPGNPTTADCVPLDFVALPNDIPSPSACCTETVDSKLVVEQCIDDCAYAACKLAIAKMREAALSLPEKGPKGVVRDDLFYLADLLDSPTHLETCANHVIKAQGELATIALGAGSSDQAEFGHVQDATLNLRCALDPLEPFAISDEPCEVPPNSPIPEHESPNGGVIAFGTVIIHGPNGQSHSALRDIAFAFMQTHNHDGSIDFLLTDFTALATATRYGNITYTHPSLRLLAPASARLRDETITFPAGSLRVEATATLVADQQGALFGGDPISTVYVNTEPATATRTADTFAISEATFESDAHRFVLSTGTGSVRP